MSDPVAAKEPARRVRRERSATESLLSIALLLEAILVFFVIMAAYGLRVLPAGVVFGGGVVLIALLLLDGRLVRSQWGIWLGWALQIALVAIGMLIPLMYFVGSLFLLIWIYCFVVGRRLDRRKAEYLANNPPATTWENK